MRTIKFRGYNHKNKQWLYGCYLFNRGKHFVAPEGLADPQKTWEDFEIDIDTLGQYFGLRDRNGREIYEGDIVDVWSQGSHCKDGIVMWGSGRCGFFIGNATNTMVWNLSGDHNGREALEVIGNVHEQNAIQRC